jgi:hypothetical protein
MADRRKAHRPVAVDRRSGIDRRQAGQTHFGRGTSEFSQLVNRTFAVLRQAETRGNSSLESEGAE